MMEEEKSANFGIVDYCVFGGMLVISLGIGAVMSFIGNKSPIEFLMGNRSFKPLPVAMSLLTSYVSAVSLLGFSGEIYANGMQLSPIVLGIIIAILFSSYFVLPMLYPLKLMSVNEYIELRFKSKRLSLAIFFLNMVRALLACGVVLYAPTIALASITNLSYLTNIFLLGIVCTIYSSFGGVRAVIWTDFFQLIVMLIGLATMVTVGVVQSGGVVETLYRASKGERLHIFEMNLSPFARHTFFNTFAMGFFLFASAYSCEQTNLQRMCAVKTIKHAKRVLTYNLFGMVLIYFFIFSCGLVSYTNYAGCDPMALGLITRREQILPYFIMNKLSFIPGLPGILVATLVGGSLSTISSMLNGCVALVWRDVCLKFNHFKTASSTYATMVNKIISLIIGSLLIGLAILSSKAGSLLEITLTVVGASNGPFFGVYLIGFFLPKCNVKGVWTGFILSLILMTWLALGNLFYKLPTKMLPFSADECPYSNFTLMNISRVGQINSFTSGTMEDSTPDTSFLITIYRISYTLYPGIGTVLCVLVGLIVSYITGNQMIHETSPKFISPAVHRFYWSKEELSSFKEKEDKEELSSLQGKEDKLDLYDVNGGENNLENYTEKLKNTDNNLLNKTNN